MKHLASYRASCPSVSASSLRGALADQRRSSSAQSPPKQAVVETTAGTFVIDLTPDTAPNQTAYFMKLAPKGAYDGTIFTAW